MFYKHLLFFFFRGVGSLSQLRLNIFTVGNMRVMIYLGQGGLRSLSASSICSMVSYRNEDSIYLSKCKGVRQVE